jgi:hypothetical protein
MEELIKKYEEARKYANELYEEILETSDGFRYLTQLRCYGSIRWQSHKNEFSVQDLCNDYYGDNGIVDVYTNNPNHKIESYGGVRLMTEEEMVNLSKEDISMSNAVCNWIVRTLG